MWAVLGRRGQLSLCIHPFWTHTAELSMLFTTRYFYFKCHTCKVAVLQVLIKKNTWGLLKGSWWIELSSTHTQDGLCVDRVYKWLKAGHSSILYINLKDYQVQIWYKQHTDN